MGASELFFGFEWHSFRYPEEKDPGVAAYLAALEALGFQRLGVKWEAPPGWERMHSLEFASPQHQCFASCAVSNGEPSLHLLTTFTDGTVVVTWFGSVNAQSRSRRFVHRNVRGDSPPELLAAHTEEVQRQQAKGKEVCDDWSAQGRLDASCLYYANPDNPLALYGHRQRAFWLSALCDVAFAAVWLLVLLWPVNPQVALALVVNVSATMALSHWSATRGAPRTTAWLATAMAVASIAAGTMRFLS